MHHIQNIFEHIRSYQTRTASDRISIWFYMKSISEYIHGCALKPKPQGVRETNIRAPRKVGFEKSSLKKVDSVGLCLCTIEDIQCECRHRFAILFLHDELCFSVKIPESIVCCHQWKSVNLQNQFHQFKLTNCILPNEKSNGTIPIVPILWQSVFLLFHVCVFCRIASMILCIFL